MNVAQLKLELDGEVINGRSMFPRLNERGSIEARVRVPSCSFSTSFPRLNERGSIEAGTNESEAGAPQNCFHV